MEYPWWSAFTGGSIAGDVPLMDDLNINITTIKEKTVFVLNPLRRSDKEALKDVDLIGPLLFFFALGCIMSVLGKGFGIVYATAMIGWIAVYLLINTFGYAINFYGVGGVLGYCLLPTVFLGLLSMTKILHGFFGNVIAGLSIIWSTFSATSMFLSVLNTNNKRFCFGYPIFLLYLCFCLLIIF